MDGFNRRQFLTRLGGASLGAAALSAVPSWARKALAATAAPSHMIVRNDWPEHWESTIEALDQSWITPNDAFFIRSHFPVPTQHLEDYRLQVTGLVNTPLSLTLDQLAGLPAFEAVCTLECAGNGRGLFKLPSTSGTQWGRGAVGNARWGGVRLSSLLNRAGVRPDASHVWFEAADRAPNPNTPVFLRSIPLKKALDDTMLALTMNGAALPVFHGAPVRAIVPGWYGMASTKWVTAIRVESKPSDNHFMANGYHYTYEGEPKRPVEEMVVKSLITQPLDGASLPTGRVRIEGYAWAAPVGVRIVEVSLDRGKSWQPAGFMGDREPNAWRRFATEIDFDKPGRQTVMARATDGKGVAQPLEAKPNAGGYANNSIHTVSFTLQGAKKG